MKDLHKYAVITFGIGKILKLEWNCSWNIFSILEYATYIRRQQKMCSWKLFCISDFVQFEFITTALLHTYINPEFVNKYLGWSTEPQIKIWSECHGFEKEIWTIDFRARSICSLILLFFYLLSFVVGTDFWVTSKCFFD